MPANSHLVLNVLLYFMTLTLGSTASIAGLANKYIAAHFSVENYVIGYCFTVYSVAYAGSVFSVGWMLEKFSVRSLLRVYCGLGALAIICFANAPSLVVFSIFLFLFGCGMGILLPTAFHVTLLLYDAKVRAAKSIAVTFFYAVGSIVGPILAGLAFDRGVTWQGVYYAIAAMLLAVVLGTFIPELKGFEPKKTNRGDEKVDWNLNVYLAGLSVFCFMISEFIFGYWIIQYLMDSLAVGVVLASAALSAWWGCITTGRLAGSFILSRVSLAQYIIVSAAVGSLAYFGLLAAATYTQALVLIVIMGFAYSSLYPTLISFGTFQTPKPSPRTTSFFLASGSAGIIFSVLLSSSLKQYFDYGAVLAAGASLIGAVALVTAAVAYRNKKRPFAHGA
ncbi:MFS transporter [Anaeroselena agilis]|uniref:MFS transporter n=1 Tax=Anaeroselena agilis TaxID=3063788 RepID=A0ABU3P3H6_9FIRM|nr:MFS transporter [Selenomonadales bacterium 4137-cl]